MLKASNLRIVREFYGLHQSHLAEMLGVDRSYIAHIEGGQRPLTDALQARTMQALQLTPDKLDTLLGATQAYEDARQSLLK